MDINQANNVPEADNTDTEIEDTEDTELSTANSIFVIKRTFDQLLAVIDKQDTLLAPTFLEIMFKSMRIISDQDMQDLSGHIRKQLGKKFKTPYARSQIEDKISAFLNKDETWKGRTFVGELNGQMYLGKEETPRYISNFILTPKSTITVDQGEKYHVFNAEILINNGKNKEVKEIILKSADFNNLTNLQKQVEVQLMGTSAYINGCQNNMGDIYYKCVDLIVWQHQKRGTSLIGLERLEENGPKYFCTPNAIYDINGQKSEDIVYMGNSQSNQEELKNLSNLEYNKESWSETAKAFLSNVTHVHEKNAMMTILGWMGVIPHDYVIRKESNTGFFPLCHIVGEPGSGKSTILTLMKQFMGHNDSSPRTFPTAFETSKLLNSSYTIPAVLDEYAKRWKPEVLEAMNKVLVECFTKARWSRGTSNLGSIYYKYKNPLLFSGQIPTEDQALATRIIPVRFYKSFQNSKNGKKAIKALETLQSLHDKNFWVGYNLWCAKHSNDEVKKVFNKYKRHCRSLISENRVADIFATVLVGLHYMRKLAEELGVMENLGYDVDDILDMANKLQSSSEAAQMDGNNPLDDFLNELAQYAISTGNSNLHGSYFGKKLAVSLHQPGQSGTGEYGRTTKYPACIHNRELVVIKIDEMVNVLNKKRGSNVHNFKEIMTFVDGAFRESLQKPNDPTNLVLAPKQYRAYTGMYTAFNKARLVELYPEFQEIAWRK